METLYSLIPDKELISESDVEYFENSKFFKVAEQLIRSRLEVYGDENFKVEYLFCLELRDAFRKIGGLAFIKPALKALHASFIKYLYLIRLQNKSYTDLPENEKDIIPERLFNLMNNLIVSSPPENEKLIFARKPIKDYIYQKFPEGRFEELVSIYRDELSRNNNLVKVYLKPNTEG